ncbi:Gfo/Idh/MocA family protein [Roseococcus microcysteis]|uniref:Gfo/Idh/MocA family protein n=1 Tax=Roseococcus microcysteis TaxID=2771361 RepID=UPI00168B4189|nr:Gfo/Idh/MocA family oxidoreductase [Roseococcus microcysteis]
MNFVVIGCGFVADYYMASCPDHSGLRLLGAFDRNPTRLDAFARFHGTRAYPSLEAVLADPEVALVVNLTNPRSHVEVSRAALLAGKHVYSEKPLALTMAEAEELVALAAERGLALAAAPCNHLAPPVQEMAALVEAGRLGRPLMAQAEMDDGLIPFQGHEAWRSASGAPWPAADEFEMGCVLEHAGYQIGPLVTLFGPVREVVAMPAQLLPEKGEGLGPMNPDFSVGVLRFDHGVVARLSLSIIAPHNRLLRVVGTQGFATIPDVWDNRARLRLSPTGKGLRHRAARKLELKLGAFLPGVTLGRALPVPYRPRPKGRPPMDYLRGVAQLAAQVEQGAPSLMGPDLALHVTEVTLALQSQEAAGRIQTMRTGLAARPREARLAR